MRRAFSKFSVVLTGGLILAACGGNGGGGSVTPPPSEQDTFYVRASGSDANNGESPAQALRSITRAVALATDNDMIIVGPGSYVGQVDINVAGTAPGRGLKVIADPSGVMTDDEDDAGAVQVEPGEGQDVGFRFTGAGFAVIDGFRIANAREGDNAVGVQLRSAANGVTIRNCEIVNNRDGIRMQDSDDALIFNNLIVNNTNRGIRIGSTREGTGSQRAQLINNTVADNGGVGISIGDDDIASAGAHLFNNIVQNNDPRNIVIAGNAPSSVDGYMGDYNLVFLAGSRPGDVCAADSTPSQCGYGPFAARGTNDVNADAVFFRPDRDEFDLEDGSPAINTGTSDEAFIGAELVDILEARSTTGDIEDNDGLLDLGYHFLFQ